MSILITVPHAGCFSRPMTRHCDIISEKAALNLLSFLPESEIIIGRAYRETLDLNRDESLDHPFRKEIREIVQEINPNIVLDIHSFPDGSDYFGDTDLTILDEKPGTSYGEDLFRYLEAETTYHIGYFPGIKNSIMREMRDMGIPCLLIEYSEALHENDITTLNEVIVEWLVFSVTYM